ncbi:hypothetical protein HY572_00755 [Candidatus Micrarchaeota archaeon]|nr:hypothetical protein [Candidatus Micrarchaeota archaeon]
MKLLAALLLASVFLFGCVQPPGGAQATPTPIQDVLHEDVTPTQTPTVTATPTETPSPEAASEPTEVASEPNATATLTPTQTPTPEPGVYVEVDDNAWYPGEITVKKGVPLKLTIKMRDTNVYFAGGDVKSDAFETVRFAVGETKTVEFTPQGQVKISNYWPTSGVLKGTLTINVN